MPTVGSLFSGIGGLDHGLARTGWEHAFLCESDEWRRGVLRERFPGVPIYGDVREVGPYEGTRKQSDGRPCPDSRPDQWANCDLLTGGFPCQDVSVAGRRAGLNGKRSGLFFEFARVAESLRPRLLLVENVPGLFSSNGGRDFGVVLGTLADLGYGLGWRVLDSRFFGVPQRRRRVFVVGVLAGGDPRAAAERAGEILAVGQGCDRHLKAGGETGSEVAVASLSGLGSGGPDDNDGQGGRLIADTVRSHPRPGSNSHGLLVAHALTSEGHDASEDGTGRGTPLIVAAPLSHGSNPNSNMAGRRREDDENLVLGWNWQSGGDVRHSFSEQSPALQTSQIPAAGVRRLMPVECERLQALPDAWTRVPDAAPDSRRYAALGDAVTASVAQWIGARLLQHLNAGREAEDSPATKGTGSPA